MSRKSLSSLRATAVDGAVELTFYKGAELFAANKGTQPVRIWRRAEPGFPFGTDYREYFDDLDWRGAEMVFEGTLDCSNQRKARWVDRSVGVGFTGAYWVQVPGDENAVGPAPVRVRDPEIWWTYARLRSEAEALARDFPSAVRLDACGHSLGGSPIITLGVGPERPAIAFVGLVHAGEAGPELLLPMLRGLLSEHRDLAGQTGVAILPNLNPDEREAMACGTPWYLRTNHNGVDLNRNFDAAWDEVSYGYGLDSSDPDAATYRGPAPSSEPETQAAVRFIEAQRPQAVFSFHCLASICSNAFLTTAKAVGDAAFAERAVHIARAYDQGMFPENTAETRVHYACSAGSLPHWAYARFGMPAFDLELGPNPDAKACVHDGTTRAMLETYRRRHLDGLVRVLTTLRREGPP